MSGTIVTHEARAVPPVVSSVQDIPLERIHESSSNPRRVFDEAQLRELAANIKSHGVLQAILVRPSPDGAGGTYELVAGTRRFRASKLAGKNTIPATVRNLTDAEAQEVRLIENLQRSNIHELDEGIGYRSLIDLRPDFYTVETIAAQVCKSPSYVKGRISLTELIPAAQTAFYDGRLTVAHALEIARLQPRDQEKALMECFPGHRSTGSILKDRKAEALTVRQLREWIEREIHLDLKMRHSIHRTRICFLQRAHARHARKGLGVIHCSFRRSRTSLYAWTRPVIKQSFRRLFNCGLVPW